jgi:hypothetical protein
MDEESRHDNCDKHQHEWNDCSDNNDEDSEDDNVATEEQALLSSIPRHHRLLLQPMKPSNPRNGQYS